MSFGVLGQLQGPFVSHYKFLVAMDLFKMSKSKVTRSVLLLNDLVRPLYLSVMYSFCDSRAFRSSIRNMLRDMTVEIKHWFCTNTHFITLWSTDTEETYRT